MRDIKFRGKPIKNNTSYFEDEEFAYGSLMINEDKYYILLDVLDNIKRDDYAVYMVEVKPETIGQYTGLKDRNGTEIYTGDIVRLFGGHYEQGFYEWDETEVVKDLIKDGYELQLCLDQGVNCEVIGNIYDNKNLLEEE